MSKPKIDAEQFKIIKTVLDKNLECQINFNSKEKEEVHILILFPWGTLLVRLYVCGEYEGGEMIAHYPAHSSIYCISEFYDFVE